MTTHDLTATTDDAEPIDRTATARFVLMRLGDHDTIAVNLDHVLTIAADRADTVDGGRRRARGSVVLMTGGVTLRVRDNYQALVATIAMVEPDEPTR